MYLPVGLPTACELACIMPMSNITEKFSGNARFALLMVNIGHNAMVLPAIPTRHHHKRTIQSSKVHQHGATSTRYTPTMQNSKVNEHRTKPVYEVLTLSLDRWIAGSLGRWRFLTCDHHARKSR